MMWSVLLRHFETARLRADDDPALTGDECRSLTRVAFNHALDLLLSPVKDDERTVLQQKHQSVSLLLHFHNIRFKFTLVEDFKARIVVIRLVLQQNIVNRYEKYRAISPVEQNLC